MSSTRLQPNWHLVDQTGDLCCGQITAINLGLGSSRYGHIVCGSSLCNRSSLMNEMVRLRV